jgi:hypothetical protein
VFQQPQPFLKLGGGEGFVSHDSKSPSSALLGVRVRRTLIGRALASPAVRPGVGGGGSERVREADAPTLNITHPQGEIGTLHNGGTTCFRRARACEADMGGNPVSFVGCKWERCPVEMRLTETGSQSLLLFHTLRTAKLATP